MSCYVMVTSSMLCLIVSLINFESLINHTLTLTTNLKPYSLIVQVDAQQVLLYSGVTTLVAWLVGLVLLVDAQPPCISWAKTSTLSLGR